MEKVQPNGQGGLNDINDQMGSHSNWQMVELGLPMLEFVSEGIR